MQTEKLTIDDIIIKTTEALIGAGLRSNSAWGHYHKFYVMLSGYQHSMGIDHYDLSTIDSFMKKQEERCNAGEICRREFRNIRRAIKIMIDYVANDVIDTPATAYGTKFILSEPFETLLAEYLASRTFHPNTQDDVVWAVRRFLYYLDQIGHKTLHCVTDEHVRKFLVLMSERLASGSLKNMMCYLREFGDFAYRNGYTGFDFAPMFAVKVRRENRVYPILADDELERTLSQIDTNTVMGKRDMAMIMLGVTTGMRAIDIVNLRLCDIDWLRGELRLVQRKTGNPVILPLMPKAGEAIKEYILNARPKCSSEYIFLTTKFPIRKFTDDTTFGYMFGKYERMAGIERKPFDGKGFHSLRRRIATKMIVSGVPVTTVSQVLGQMEMDSAKQYLVFDVENLRECAIGLDGIEVAGGVFHD